MAPGEIGPGRHRTAGGTAAYEECVDAVTVPAGGALSVSPHGVEVTLRAGAGRRTGDLVPFTPHFGRSAPVEAIAVVVRPGDRPS
ncbi:hypothetical protein Shyhy01_30590 [Streptomyces hygroscopicus subsp. hygroscopicus]|nr:hypothetical protein Shyhy01_30590 [Streptomyces hygroscopicus subsp. hygroscopicus]